MQIPHPIKIIMTRDGANDSHHATLVNARGMILGEPKVGDSIQVYFEDQKWMRTSPIKRVARVGSTMTVETANSTYRMKIAA